MAKSQRQKNWALLPKATQRAILEARARSKRRKALGGGYTDSQPIKTDEGMPWPPKKRSDGD